MCSIRAALDRLMVDGTTTAGGCVAVTVHMTLQQEARTRTNSVLLRSTLTLSRGIPNNQMTSDYIPTHKGPTTYQYHHAEDQTPNTWSPSCQSSPAAGHGTYLQQTGLC